MAEGVEEGGVGAFGEGDALDGVDADGGLGVGDELDEEGDGGFVGLFEEDHDGFGAAFGIGLLDHGFEHGGREGFAGVAEAAGGPSGELGIGGFGGGFFDGGGELGGFEARAVVGDDGGGIGILELGDEGIDSAWVAQIDEGGDEPHASGLGEVLVGEGVDEGLDGGRAEFEGLGVGVFAGDGVGAEGADEVIEGGFFGGVGEFGEVAIVDGDVEGVGGDDVGDDFFVDGGGEDEEGFGADAAGREDVGEGAEFLGGIGARGGGGDAADELEGGVVGEGVEWGGVEWEGGGGAGVEGDLFGGGLGGGEEDFGLALGCHEPELDVFEFDGGVAGVAEFDGGLHFSAFGGGGGEGEAGLDVGGGARAPGDGGGFWGVLSAGA